jgi:hypothetical protein
MKKFVKLVLALLVTSFFAGSLAHADDNNEPVVVNGVSDTVLLVD